MYKPAQYNIDKHRYMVRAHVVMPSRSKGLIFKSASDEKERTSVISSLTFYCCFGNCIARCVFLSWPGCPKTRTSFR